MSKGNPKLEASIRAALEAVRDSATGTGLISAGRISGLVVRGEGRVGFAIEAPGLTPAEVETLRAAAERAAAGVAGVTSVTAVATAHLAAGPGPTSTVRRTPPVQASGAQTAPSPAAPALQRAARLVVLVASAKGGVGKSTVAANLAVAAARQGLRVGLLDADVFGPSVPTMMGLAGARPEAPPEGRTPGTGPGGAGAKKLRPIRAHGVATMSLGYLVKPDNAIVWRGPMVTSAVMQLLNDTDWGDLDLLLVDTPPGTGEVQLTLVQRAVIDGAVIVSTPQEVALADVRRGIAMFRKTAIEVIGIIENMAWFESGDGVRHHLFGEGGARRTAADEGVRFLGEAPILPALREGGDAGAPAAGTDGPAADVFTALLGAMLDAAAAAPGRPAPVILFED
ncbi:P-loop NTPase [bacterium]|nr:P-loop NTPase [bacterium]